MLFKSYQITILQANIGYSYPTRTHPHYLVGWPSLLVAWGEEPAEELVEIGSEEGRTAVAPWAAVEVLGEAVEEQEEEEEQKEQEGILPAGSWAAPSPRRADTVPSVAPRGGASAGAAGSCRSSTAWQLGPRSTRSQRNRPERCRCLVTSPWQGRDWLRGAPWRQLGVVFVNRQETSRFPRYPRVDTMNSPGWTCQNLRGQHINFSKIKISRLESSQASTWQTKGHLSHLSDIDIVQWCAVKVFRWCRNPAWAFKKP